ncbi:50S ribosomal protein L29 [Candidatus Dependentiae bacterium]|nr:50S ribosomal protein L29 [Candidatus Dependentiae bacterium]
MKKNSKTELKQMSSKDLMIRAQEIRKELFVLRMRKISNPEKNTALGKSLRKRLACTLTFLNQKGLHDKQ